MADVEITEQQISVTTLRIPLPATRRQLSDLLWLADKTYLERFPDDPHLRDGVPYDDAYQVDTDAGMLVVRISDRID